MLIKEGHPDCQAEVYYKLAETFRPYFRLLALTLTDIGKAIEDKDPIAKYKAEQKLEEEIEDIFWAVDE